MPLTEVFFYQDDEGSIPLAEWLDSLPAKIQNKCLVRLERLENLGHEIRRPEADYLRDGIYNLHVRFQSVNYRMLYFFLGNVAAVISHGCTKEQEVPPKEIDLAVERKAQVLANPKRHLFKSEE